MRRSRQRDLILEVLRESRGHPTADWIYREVKKEMPRISLGTVYRNLRILKETGAIMELNHSDGQSRFDGIPENHYHFTCRKCGTVYDVGSPLRDEMELDVAQRHGFVVNSHRMEFHGVCRKCPQNNDLKGVNK